jgi:hypothetical protein
MSPPSARQWSKHWRTDPLDLSAEHPEVLPVQWSAPSGRDGRSPRWDSAVETVSKGFVANLAPGHGRKALNPGRPATIEYSQFGVQWLVSVNRILLTPPEAYQESAKICPRRLHGPGHAANLDAHRTRGMIEHVHGVLTEHTGRTDM